MVSLDEVLELFRDLNHVVLATVENNSPRLRPMTMVMHNGSFYFATGSSAKKVRHLEENPEGEFILQWKEESNNGYIRVRGKANKVKDLETISGLYNRFEYFSKLWKSPTDPTLVVYNVEPSLYDYLKPGEWESVQIKP
jgi:uncharacterized pyridoxamine 5'-phosphate oxidase family protein